MIIGICGLGYTGSGAVIDLLKEFADVNVMDEPEFTICYMPDGIYHLEKALFDTPIRYMSSDAAFFRFLKLTKNLNSKNSYFRKVVGKNFKTLVDNYLDSITQIKWKGNWGFDVHEMTKFQKNIKFRIPAKIDKIFPRLSRKYSNYFSYKRLMRYSVKPLNFDDSTRSFIRSLIFPFNENNNKTTVLNQPFPGDNPTICFKYFDNPIAIIVDRDPRDLFILAKELVTKEATWIPTDNILDFINYYKKMRENTVKEDQRILRINFEDLIYDYDLTVKRISKFTGLSTHLSPKKYFKNEVSMKNTMLFYKFQKYEKEIKQIEVELSDFLYSFPDKKNLGIDRSEISGS